MKWNGSTEFRLKINDIKHFKLNNKFEARKMIQILENKKFQALTGTDLSNYEKFERSIIKGSG